MREKTCCLSGHRQIPSDELPAVKEKLTATLIRLIDRGYRFFGCGGALGFDMLAAKTIISLKAHYPNIAIILVLPCRDQARKWSKKDISEYEYIKSNADKIVYTAEKYFEGCMHTRNRHLVDGSSVCLCYLKKGGGTAFTVKYAKECGLEIINLH